MTGVAAGGHGGKREWTVNRSIDVFCFEERLPPAP
jgi:hypothetical protein